MHNDEAEVKRAAELEEQSCLGLAPVVVGEKAQVPLGSSSGGGMSGGELLLYSG